MKKLLLLLVLLPKILLSQEPPLLDVSQSSEYSCSAEYTIKETKKKRDVVLSLSYKEEIDIIDYLVNTPRAQVREFLDDYSRSGQTDIYSNENALLAVDYFKNTVIQQIDPNLTVEATHNFVKYFRVYDYHSFYQSEVTQSDSYVNALFSALRVLYNHEPYWEKTISLNQFREQTTFLMDIEGHRSKIFDLFLLNLEKTTPEWILNNPKQESHLWGLSYMMWRAFINWDVDFINLVLRDQRVFDLIFQLIDNKEYKVSNNYYLQTNFIGNFDIIFKTLSDQYFNWYDIDSLAQRILVRFNESELGDNHHVAWTGALINLDYDFGIDFENIKEQYYQSQFTKVTTLDGGLIRIHSKLSDEKIESLYLALRDAKSNFFKLIGSDDPLPNDPNEIIDMYIFEDQINYRKYGKLLFNIPTNNGGIYIESYPALYTFDREDDLLPLDMLLKHEYVHYLDGRYNIQYDYAVSDFYDWSKSVFWVEGLANFVSSAKVDSGYHISYYSGSGITDDVLKNQTRTFYSSINTSYSAHKMYQYAEATWSFLYQYAYDDLLDLFKLVQTENIQAYRNRLDSIAQNSGLEPLFQEFLQEIKESHQSGNTADPILKSYDFTKPIISNDSIQHAFETLGLTGFELKTPSSAPYDFIAAHNDTIVENVIDAHIFLESIGQSVNDTYYSGYYIMTAQINQIEQVDSGFKVYYSVELPLNGEFEKEEEVDPDPEDPVDPVDPIDPIDPVDPVDPVDPEPIITELILYPNPTVNEVNVTGLPDNSTIYIYDVNGRVRISEFHKSGIFKCNVSRLNTGLYFLVYPTNGGIKSIKFVKR